MTLTDQRFATLAVERGFITSSQLDRARERLQKQGGELAALLVEMGLITSPQRQTLQGFIDREHAAAKDPENLVGEVLGGCRIIRSVGTGGMGSTYLAHHQRLDREVAVKVLHPRLTRIPNMAERFKREAQAAAKLSHPNIISVFDFDRVGDLYFMIMEFVRGRNLKEILEESGPFSVPDSIYIIDEVLKGLTVAHDLGIVHRDIKPANIILDEQTRRVSITDFGTVRLLNSASSQNLSSFGEILGTPQYMAPEQATADEIDGRTDLYAVGITLFELLEGRAPFSGASAVEVLEKQILSELPPLSEKNSGLSEFVAKLTAKKKEDRFANATEAARRLEILFRRMSHNFADLNLHRDPSRATNVPAIDSGSIDAIAQRLQHGQHLALVSFEAAEQEQAAPTQDPAKGTAAVLQSALSGDLDHVLAEIAQGPKGDTLVPELLLLLWQKSATTSSSASPPSPKRPSPKSPPSPSSRDSPMPRAVTLNARAPASPSPRASTPPTSKPRSTSPALSCASVASSRPPRSCTDSPCSTLTRRSPRPGSPNSSPDRARTTSAPPKPTNAPSLSRQIAATCASDSPRSSSSSSPSNALKTSSKNSTNGVAPRTPSWRRSPRPSTRLAAPARTLAAASDASRDPSNPRTSEPPPHRPLAGEPANFQTSNLDSSSCDSQSLAAKCPGSNKSTATPAPPTPTRSRSPSPSLKAHSTSARSSAPSASSKTRSKSTPAASKLSSASPPANEPANKAPRTDAITDLEPAHRRAFANFLRKKVSWALALVFEVSE
jgi:serine/threonine protein kinase